MFSSGFMLMFCSDLVHLRFLSVTRVTVWVTVWHPGLRRRLSCHLQPMVWCTSCPPGIAPIVWTCPKWCPRSQGRRGGKLPEFHGISLVFTWCLSVFILHIWYLYGIYMVFIWYMVLFIWYLYGIYMVFIWYLCIYMYIYMHLCLHIL